MINRADLTCRLQPSPLRWPWAVWISQPAVAPWRHACNNSMKKKCWRFLNSNPIRLHRALLIHRLERTGICFVRCNWPGSPELPFVVVVFLRPVLGRLAVFWSQEIEHVKYRPPGRRTDGADSSQKHKHTRSEQVYLQGRWKTIFQLGELTWLSI